MVNPQVAQSTPRALLSSVLKRDKERVRGRKRGEEGREGDRNLAFKEGGEGGESKVKVICGLGRGEEIIPGRG